MVSAPEPPPTLARRLAEPSLTENVRVVDVWTADGVRLALTEYGGASRAARPGADAPAFLLLPGFAQNRRAFLAGPLPRALVARGARVFVGELRGHGRSRGLKRPPRWTVDGHIDHDLPALTARVLRLTGAGGVHFVGHSLGGLLALAWLKDHPPLASLTTMAAPLLVGSDRPIVPRAALVAAAFNRLGLWREVPMRAFLRACARPLSDPRPDWVSGAFQRYAALATPECARPESLKRILATADPESPAVFGALLEMAIQRRPVLAGHDLEAHGRATTVPWVAIHGERDIFAPPSSVASMLEGEHRGPRSVIDVPRATHVDLVVGYHVRALVERWWPMLFPVDKRSSTP